MMKKKRFKFSILVIFISVILLGSAVLILQSNYYPPILMYHSLDPSRNNTPTISSEGFFRHMQFIKRHGYRVISLEELARELKEGKIPRKTVVITFDDGYKDNLKAVEVLRKFGFPATIFMIVGRIGDSGFLTKEDLLRIEKGSKIRIGLHTINHCILYKCRDPEFEIREGKRRLEQVLGHPVNVFSYPVGGFNREIQEIVKSSGFLCAVTTNRGYSRGIDLYALRRIKMKDSDRGLS